jgi:hypothetical protein
MYTSVGGAVNGHATWLQPGMINRDETASSSATHATSMCRSDIFETKIFFISDHSGDGGRQRTTFCGDVYPRRLLKTSSCRTPNSEK